MFRPWLFLFISRSSLLKSVYFHFFFFYWNMAAFKQTASNFYKWTFPRLNEGHNSEVQTEVGVRGTGARLKGKVRVVRVTGEGQWVWDSDTGPPGPPPLHPTSSLSDDRTVQLKTSRKSELHIARLVQGVRKDEGRLIVKVTPEGWRGRPSHGAGEGAAQWQSTHLCEDLDRVWTELSFCFLFFYVFKKKSSK